MEASLVLLAVIIAIALIAWAYLGMQDLSSSGANGQYYTTVSGYGTNSASGSWSSTAGSTTATTAPGSVNGTTTPASSTQRPASNATTTW